MPHCFGSPTPGMPRLVPLTQEWVPRTPVQPLGTWGCEASSAGGRGAGGARPEAPCATSPAGTWPSVGRRALTLASVRRLACAACLVPARVVAMAAGVDRLLLPTYQT